MGYVQQYLLDAKTRKKDILLNVVEYQEVISKINKKSVNTIIDIICNEVRVLSKNCDKFCVNIHSDYVAEI